MLLSPQYSVNVKHMSVCVCFTKHIQYIPLIAKELFTFFRLRGPMSPVSIGDLEIYNAFGDAITIFL